MFTFSLLILTSYHVIVRYVGLEALLRSIEVLSCHLNFFQSCYVHYTDI